VFNIAEFCGHIKHALYDNKYKICEIPPTVHKKFVTGKGTADKVKTTDSILSQYPQLKQNKELMTLTKYASPQADIFDAISLALTMECKINMREHFEYNKTLSKEKLEVMRSTSKSNKLEFWKREYNSV
jgi:Holliday junction resolvasome RuvABC endonuclease subunit